MGFPTEPDVWLPLVFAGLMGVSILIYVMLDGFDLGVGVLTPLATDAEKNRMIASIGPFWDANETWLVLAVGLLLVAFPAAHGAVEQCLLHGLAHDLAITRLYARRVHYGSELDASHSGFWALDCRLYDHWLRLHRRMLAYN
jgi:cytochrome d ubiquinol oxidase subunit II